MLEDNNDTGWAGKWEPNVVSASCLEELRQLAGEPVMSRGRGQSQGRPLSMVKVNLKTGDFTYPA